MGEKKLEPIKWKKNQIAKFENINLPVESMVEIMHRKMVMMEEEVVKKVLKEHLGVLPANEEMKRCVRAFFKDNAYKYQLIWDGKILGHIHYNYGQSYLEDIKKNTVEYGVEFIPYNVDFYCGDNDFDREERCNHQCGKCNG